MKLIIGLGNPGREYAGNRHNLGFMCLSHLAREYGIRLESKRGLARTGTGEIAGNEVMLARPQTYMNLSGESVSRLVNKFKINLSDLLIIHDDLDLPLGKMRIRPGGGAGGHRGVKSIIASIGSGDFPRLRIGIGRPAELLNERDISDDAIVDYVLSDFATEEKKIVTEALSRASEVVTCFLADGLATAMNKYN